MTPTPGRIVAFANRLPVVKSRDGWESAAGGLVTSLRPVLKEQKGSWVGWDGGAHDIPSQLPELGIDLYPVNLSRQQIEGYYFGFCNRTLWPLLHDFLQIPIFDTRWWELYRAVNEKFAHARFRLPRDVPGTLWVHDFHLMLLPQLLRRRRPMDAIAFFLHTPFPEPALFARLPWRRQMLKGILGADLVGFHTKGYRDNFLATCDRFVDDVKVHSNWIELEDGRRVAAAVHPISVDAIGFSSAAVKPAVDRQVNKLRTQFAFRKVFLGVDRADYTKGIIERLNAFEMLLERRPDLRGDVAFIQIAIPSRDDVKEYKDLRAQIEGDVGRINGRFTRPGEDVPVHYLYRHLTRNQMLAYYRLADVAVVTPLKDGMNLVAKEFVVTQAAAGGHGVLVLSEFAGAAQELTEALICNPFDVEGLSVHMEKALAMDEPSARARLQAMATKVHRRDVSAWASDFLADLAGL